MKSIKPPNHRTPTRYLTGLNSIPDSCLESLFSIYYELLLVEELLKQAMDAILDLAVAVSSQWESGVSVGR